jgi:hypothetical protein
MNLADMLSYADIQQLSTIAKNYQCECDGHSKNELIQSILSAFGRSGAFEKYLENLSLEDMRFLNSVLFDQRDVFSLEELIARVSQTKFSKEEKEQFNPREMISKYKQRGWLFNGFSRQTKYLFQIPQDVKRRFGESMAKLMRQEIKPATKEPEMYRDEQKIIADDIYQFMHFVYHNEVLTTGDGTIYKRTLQQILDSLSIREELVGKTAWRFGYGRKFKDYPNRFSLIYDYCYYHDLIVETGGFLELTEKGKQKVLAARKEDLMEVYRLWIRLYKGPILNLQSLVQWINKLCPEWVTVNSLMSTLGRFIKPFYYDTPESIMEQRILQIMLHLGLIRIGENDTDGRLVQMTAIGRNIIQGTYVAEEDKIEIPIDNK